MVPDCLVILSGGMDSTVLLYDILDKGGKAAAISFDYGSRHNARELPMAVKTCEALGVSHRIIELPFIGELFSSALLKNGAEIPKGAYDRDSMALTVVPFRNPILMSIGVGYAESVGAAEVLLASHGGDHALYPDCRTEFNKAFEKAVRLGTDRKVRLGFPYENLNKRDVAEIGRRLGVDFSRTWSCYNGGKTHCGVCGTCRERKEALRHAEGLDPTAYEA